MIAVLLNTEKRSWEKHSISSDNIVVVVLALTLIIVLSGCGNQTSQETKSQQPLTIKDSIQMKYNYTQNNANYKITFLEFGSVGCRECKKMEGVMQEVKENYGKDVNVVFNDVRLKCNKSICDYYNIKMIPVQILLNNEGLEVFRHLGFYSADSLKPQFDKIL